MAKVCWIYELTELIRQASDSLFVSKMKFDKAISKKPRAMQRDNNFKPQLYDGEVILLDGVNRALQSINTALKKIKTLGNWVNSTERSKANYIAALKRRPSILEKSEVVLNMSSTADRTSKNTQNQYKRKDNGHPSKKKDSEQLKNHSQNPWLAKNYVNRLQSAVKCRAETTRSVTGRNVPLVRKARR